MKARLAFVAFGVAASAMASANLLISLGIRETGFSGGTFTAIGGNGGATGGIEYVNMDLGVLPLDGQWHQFSFTLASATLTAFAGTSANGVLEGAFGTLESIRIRNTADGYAGPFQIWIDDIANTITPIGGGPTTTVFGPFEGFADAAEVMFQEPGFSGSTAANVDINTDAAGVDNTVSFSGLASYRIDYSYVDDLDTRWLRLTTFGTTTLPNPLIRFDQSSVVSFQMKAVPEPATMTALGLGVVALLARRRRK